MQTHVSWKRPLALAVTLTVLGGGAYWLEYSHKPKKEEGEKESKKLLNLKDTQVASISLIQGEQKFVFRCLDLEVKLCRPGDQSKWEMEAPLKMRADDGNVNSVLSSINNLNPTSTIDLKDESPEKRESLLKEYGLSLETRSQEGARRLEVTLPSGEKKSLFFGETHPMGGSLLTFSSAVGENQIFLSPGYFKSNFEKDLTYWRNKKLFTLSTSQVKGLAFEGGKQPLSATRKEGEWELSLAGGNPPLKGDSENIDSLISSVTYLTAKKFVAEKKDSSEGIQALKSAKKALSITLISEQGPSTLTLFEKSHLEKGKPSVDAILATVSNLDPVFELDKASKDRLNKGLKDLRMTKLLTTSERFETRRLEFSGKPIGTEPLTLESKEGKWSQSSPTGPKEISAERVQTTLDRLTGNRIKDFLVGGSIPKGENDGLKVTFSNEKGTSFKEFVFWKKDSRLYARDLKSNANEVYWVDSVVQESLPWSADYFEKSDQPAQEVPKPLESSPEGEAEHSGHGHSH